MGLGQTVAASVPAPLLESECQLSLVDARVDVFELSLSYIITRVATHCVNALRILHAAYDATN